jgi:hypothetical protein
MSGIENVITEEIEYVGKEDDCPGGNIFHLLFRYLSFFRTILRPVTPPNSALDALKLAVQHSTRCTNISAPVPISTWRR